ncbi:MAG TPA: hypothetical protein VF585_06485 [Chthoniobacterales bacterium]|jgi:gluconokinase
MKIMLFGQIGSGKTHIGSLLNSRFGIHFHDADHDLPPRIREAIEKQEPICDDMRDEFTEAIISRIKTLEATHEHFCVAQALFKNRHREKVREAIPGLDFVWVKSTPMLISERLQQRTGHLATAYYGEIINPQFELPTIPHQVIENAGDDSLLESRISHVLAQIRVTKYQT